MIVRPPQRQSRQNMSILGTGDSSKLKMYTLLEKNSQVTCELIHLNPRAKVMLILISVFLIQIN